jgi:hypothetical protein
VVPRVPGWEVAYEAGCQNLRYTILDLASFDLIQEGRIPLQKKVQLTWIGFTADGVSGRCVVKS